MLRRKEISFETLPFSSSKAASVARPRAPFFKPSLPIFLILQGLLITHIPRVCGKEIEHLDSVHRR